MQRKSQIGLLSLLGLLRHVPRAQWVTEAGWIKWKCVIFNMKLSMKMALRNLDINVFFVHGEVPHLLSLLLIITNTVIILFLFISDAKVY
jgi:hypothetical protein